MAKSQPSATAKQQKTDTDLAAALTHLELAISATEAAHGSLQKAKLVHGEPVQDEALVIRLRSRSDQLDSLASAVARQLEG